MTLEMSWIILLGFIIFTYVLLDGFGLGIGILFACIEKETDRSIMLATIMPIWDGNETWLILGAASLYGAFPSAFSQLLPAFYIPITLMLSAMIFRGVSFEFRFKSIDNKKLWDRCFFLSSALITFLQGMILGSFIQGYHEAHNFVSYYANHWINPFSVMTGFMLMSGYAMLGATWLIAKTHDKLQQQMYSIAKYDVWLVLFAMLIVSGITPIIDPEIANRWFSIPNFFYLLPLPLGSLIFLFLCRHSLHTNKEHLPFYHMIGFFLCNFSGICTSVWPYIIPRTLTFMDAAAPKSTLRFILVGMVLLLPILIGYTLYTYYIFRGKIKHHDHLSY